MTELERFLDLYINEELIRVIISGPRQKEGPSKNTDTSLITEGAGNVSDNKNSGTEGTSRKPSEG